MKSFLATTLCALLCIGSGLAQLIPHDTITVHDMSDMSSEIHIDGSKVPDQIPDVLAWRQLMLSLAPNGTDDSITKLAKKSPAVGV